MLDANGEGVALRMSTAFAEEGMSAGGYKNSLEISQNSNAGVAAADL